MPRTDWQTLSASRLPFLIAATDAGLTLEEIGQELGMTRERARQILEKEGLNQERIQQRQEQRLLALQADAKERFGSWKWRAVEAMERAGIPVTFGFAPIHNSVGYVMRLRVILMWEGKEIVLRTSSAPGLVGPPGSPLYWRGGRVLDASRPHALLTPDRVFLWWSAAHMKQLYVRAEPLKRSMPWKPARYMPDFDIPLS